MDTLIFTSNSVKPTKVEEPLTSTPHSLPQSNAGEKDKDASENVEVECVNRPVDLYKVLLLFSDVKFSLHGFTFHRWAISIYSFAINTYCIQPTRKAHL